MDELKVGDRVRFKPHRCGMGFGIGPALHPEMPYEVVQAFPYAKKTIVSVVSSNGVVFCFAHGGMSDPDTPVAEIEG